MLGGALLVGPIRPHEVVHGVVGVDGLACVAPEALDDVVLHRPLVDEPVVDVRDLQLAAAGRLQRRDHVPDRLVVEVHAGDGVLARRLLGLLQDADDALPVELRDAEMAEVLRFREPRQDDASAALLTLEVLDRQADRLLEHVVGQHHDDPVALPEALRQAQSVRDAALLLLVGVEEAVDPVVVPVPQQAEELARMCPPGDEHDLGDAGRDERLDGVRHHRPVVDRQQVLVRDAGERVEPSAFPAREDDALHRRGMLLGGLSSGAAS